MTHKTTITRKQQHTGHSLSLSVTDAVYVDPFTVQTTCIYLFCLWEHMY